MRTILKLILSKARFSDFHEKYDVLKPDLGTMDITMPVMDGLQAVNAITTLPASARIITWSRRRTTIPAGALLRTPVKPDFLPWNHTSTVRIS